MGANFRPGLARVKLDMNAVCSRAQVSKSLNTNLGMHMTEALTSWPAQSEIGSVPIQSYIGLAILWLLVHTSILSDKFSHKDEV